MELTVINGEAPYLPEEIITSILRRLPAKSLMRFQCVCKNWQHLFKTPYFIAAHLRHSHRNPSFIFSYDYLLNNLPLPLVDCDMQLRYVQKSPLFDSLVSATCFNIVGSSNGLLCFLIRMPYTFAFSFLLWNPVTKHGREVPITKLIDIMKDNYVLGFAFSPVDNDYKILAMHAKNGGAIRRVDVYSLSTGSWKEIELGNLENVSCYQSTVSSKGMIFTHGVKLGKEIEEVIVSFDIANEVFTLLSWPPLSDSSSFNVTVYEDKPAVLTANTIRGSSNIDLWVMEENLSSSEARWRWMKKFTSGPYSWVFFPGIIWRNEIVVSGIEIEDEKPKNNEPCLCLFNINTNKFKTLDIPKHNAHYFVNYVESLVPILNVHEYFNEP